MAIHRKGEFRLASVKFPGGSKSRVSKAGQRVREGVATHEDHAVIEEWRSAHRSVLNTFQAILRARTRGTGITVAQRHKRRNTIFDKLQRHPTMKLARMDDVAGCRLIFDDVSTLHQFRDKFLRAKFKHRRLNTPDKYDYILSPKQSGYRGIHDVYQYNVNSAVGRHLAGLLVEIQYRTLVQHAWATAVEVVGFVTQSQPKFEQGDRRYQKAMALASEILARAHEGERGPYPGLSNRDLLREFVSLDRELGLTKTLRGLNEAKGEIADKKNVILMFSRQGELRLAAYRDATDALRVLFELEKELPDSDIVLVRADSGEEVRLAFRNYFSDARDFLRLMEIALTKLGSSQVSKLSPREPRLASMTRR